MHRSSKGWVVAAGLAVAVLAADRVAIAGDYGCGVQPEPSCGCQAAPTCGCYAAATCGCQRHHCRVCLICKEPRSDRGASRDARAPSARAAAAPPAVVVPSAPMFAMPMMMASFPVMPAMATRSAEPDVRSSDCNERLNRLERDVRDLADAVAGLQSIVRDQTRALDAIVKKLPGEN